MLTVFPGLRTTARALCAALAVAACTVGQGRGKPLGPPSALPAQRRAARFVPLPEWYWEAVEGGTTTPKAIELPVAEATLVRIEGATRLWDDLGAEGRERLRRDGLVVLGGADAPPATRLRMGAFYMEQRRQRVPYVVTLDALASSMHLAFERALAEVDDAVLAPELDSFLAKLEARLAAEQKGAGVEVGEALQLARAIVAVARGLAVAPGMVSGELASPSAGDLAPAVAQEIASVIAHTARSPSALLGVPIDYGRFLVPPGAARPGSFRALAWLASAPLVLVARSEVRGGVIGVAGARLHTRTAMVLARVTDRDVDPAIHASWSRISRLLSFVWGPSDDVSFRELEDAASAVGVNLEDPKHAANVVTVDRIRTRTARGRAPELYDGTAAPGPAGVSLRLFGGHAPADSIALATLSRAHDSAMPSSLDLAVWLAAPEARASLNEGGGDGSARYDEVLARAIAARPPEASPSRHASLYGSQLDAIMTWLAPQDEAARPLTSVAARRATIESALAAWTRARHAGQPLSRPKPGRAARAARELQVSGAALPAFVEAAPDVIARLVATVNQMKRGLAGLGALGPTSPAMVELAEVEDILRVALRVTMREASDEPLPAEDVAALASLPARLAGLEEPGDDGIVPGEPVIAEVFVDASGHRVLSTATGAIEPAVMIVRELGTGRLVMAVGAHVAHHDLVEARTRQTTVMMPPDGGVPAYPPRAPYTGAFRTSR